MRESIGGCLHLVSWRSAVWQWNSSASRRSASRCTCGCWPNRGVLLSAAGASLPAGMPGASIASTVAGLGGNCISCLACTQSNKYQSLLHLRHDEDGLALVL